MENDDMPERDTDRRSMYRRLSDAEIQDEVHDLRVRVERLETMRDQVAANTKAFSELRGAVETLTDMVSSGFNAVQPAVERANSLKTAVQFAAIVLVPILVALIGGYVALKTGAVPSGGTK